MDLPFWLLALVAFGIINFMLISASVLVYAERKVSGYMQNRPGPNRVGPGGFLQPFADVFKLVFKEDIVPEGASRFVHSLAPVLMVVIAMTATEFSIADPKDAGMLDVGGFDASVPQVIADFVSS